MRRTSKDPQPERSDRSRLLAERLREAREYLGLPQQFVSDQTGIPRVAISAIENGKRRVEALELETLARLYKHPVAYFLEGSVEESPEINALAREARDLTEGDRAEVLRFARFLKSYGRAGQRSSRGSDGER
ncbi:MAG TPA: helix-turn-helix transcriptional regulator [Thermoleophilaceae bacterium]|nr:helix-turn-helix transcriptional regulator [Thermoleophilaceae bacterium]